MWRIEMRFERDGNETAGVRMSVTGSAATTVICASPKRETIKMKNVATTRVRNASVSGPIKNTQTLV